MYRGRLGIWKAARLASQLPPDGAVGRATEGEGFTITDHLLLTVIDYLAGANWQRANSGLARTKQSKPPEPVRRPGDAKAKLAITAAQIEAWRQRKAETSGRG